MPESNTPINKLPSSDDEPEPSSVEVTNNQSMSVETDRLVTVTSHILRDHEFTHANISLVIVDDPTIHDLNVRYLEHDYETDVLSFVLDRDDDEGLLNGEVIVSADTANRVAQELGIEFADELLLYIVHGVLHLVGYDDKSPEARIDMRAAEKEYMLAAGAKYREPAESIETRSGDTT